MKSQDYKRDKWQGVLRAAPVSVDSIQYLDMQKILLKLKESKKKKPTKQQQQNKKTGL